MWKLNQHYTTTGLLLALTITVAMAACGGGGETENADSGGDGDSEGRALMVQVETVETVTTNDMLQLTASIEPFQHTRIAAGSGGRVDSVAVAEGDLVKSRALLANIAANLAMARFKQAEAALKVANSTLERSRRLAEKELASAQALESAESALSQAEANVEIARVGLHDALVRAPHSGRVAKKHISPGEHAGPGAPLFDLVDIRKVKVIAQLAERDIPLIKVGAAAQITVDALPSQRFSGDVRQIGVVANAASRTYDLVVHVDNADEVLRPGMMARVRLVRSTLEDIPVVRRDAVVEGFDDRAVFVVDSDNKARRRPVRLGPVQGTMVAILEGVQAGDRVVVAGHRFLVGGQPVVIANGNAPGLPVADVNAAPDDDAKAQ